MSDKFFGDAKTDKQDVSLCVLLTKTSDDTPQTGVVHSEVTASYYRQGGTPQQITPLAALANVDSAHSDGGWKEVSSSLHPGIYRIDPPDAAFAAGADWVVFTIQRTGCFPYQEKWNLGSISENEVYGRLGAPAGASIAADIAAIPQPDLSNMAQQTTLEAVQTSVDNIEIPEVDLSGLEQSLSEMQTALNELPVFTEEDRAAVAAIQAKLNTFTASSITIQSEVLQDGIMQLVKGDDYFASEGRALAFTVTGLGIAIEDVESIKFSVKRFAQDESALFTVDTEFAASGDDVTLTVGLGSEQTGLLSTQLLHPFYIVVKPINGRTITKAVGSIEVIAGGGVVD